MVVSAASLTSTGLRDWLVQRVSSLVVGIYAVLILGFLLIHPHVRYHEWQQLFSHTWMRVLTLLVLLNILLHAWVGIWTVLTDYIKPHVLRVWLEVLMILALVSFLFWGIEIVWGL